MDPTVTRGSVGSTERRSAEEGATTKFCPARPLHMLPYFYGVKKFEDVQDRLVKKGDYLLIIDPETKQLMVCVRAEDDKSKHRQVIEKQPKVGKFVIRGKCDHHAQGFLNVEELITYYETYGLEVKREGSVSKLNKAVTWRQDEKPPEDSRRAFQQPQKLAHFHGRLKEEDANKLLTTDGDYLLREELNIFILSVRGHGTVLHQVMEREPKSGGYALPRENETMPLESVDYLDHLIQFHVLYEIPVAGKFKLVRLIPKTK